MKNIDYVPATEEWVRKFFGTLPKFTMRGIVVTEGETPLVVAGFYRIRGGMYLFSEEVEDRRELLSCQEIGRMGLNLMRRLDALAAKHSWLVKARVKDEIHGRMLERFGFELKASGFYEKQYGRNAK